MKILLGILCVATLAIALLAGYSIYQQRQNAEQIAEIQRNLDRVKSRVAEVDDNVGDPNDFWGGGAGGGLGGDTLASQIGDLTDRVDQLCAVLDSVAC